MLDLENLEKWEDAHQVCEIFGLSANMKATFSQLQYEFEDR